MPWKSYSLEIYIHAIGNALGKATPYFGQIVVKCSCIDLITAGAVIKRDHWSCFMIDDLD